MNEKLLEYFKSDDIHVIQCEHKWCDAYGYEKSQMKKDLLDYITNLQQENEKLKYNARGQVNDYFKDKYADEVLKSAELKKENERLKKENETLKAKLEIGKTCGFCPYYNYKSRCEGTVNLIDRTIEIIKQQPTKDDSWILSRLYGFKYALNGSDENDR